MTTSRAPAFIDALVALFRAEPGLADAKVLDGPELGADSAFEVVTVGWDGDDEGDGQAVESTQEWAGLGAHAKDEVLAVTCAAIAWSGKSDIRPVRVRAYELLAAVEDALRSDPSLGFPPPTTVALSVGNLWQQQGPNGALCRVVFTIAIKTRI